MSSETINVSGVKHLDVTVGGRANGTQTLPDNVTVNLAKNSEWIGNFSQSGTDTLTVTGSGQFDNTGVSYASGNTTIGVNVIGTGTINENQAHSSGKLEFLHSVSAGQTVTDTGYAIYGGEHGVVQVDSPLNYHATTELGYGALILEGLKATSYSYHNDMLTLFNGRTAIDTLKVVQQSFADGSPVDFGVSQVGGSVVISADGGQSSIGGKLLAMHG